VQATALDVVMWEHRAAMDAHAKLIAAANPGLRECDLVGQDGYVSVQHSGRRQLVLSVDQSRGGTIMTTPVRIWITSWTGCRRSAFPMRCGRRCITT
jgi:hypothetical protein